MCLLALFYRVVDDAPVVVGANREEFYRRGGEPPQRLEGRLRAVGGRDPESGGTWLGVNERGVLVAVTNRPQTRAPKEPRSRGLLVRDLLDCDSMKDAVKLATQELEHGTYAGCNLLLVSADAAVVLHAGDWLRVRPLPPGLHVLTNQDVNDASDRRLGHALWWLTQRSYERATDCVAALQELCGQTGNGDPAICIRKPDRGTVSSSILALAPGLAKSTYLHAQGPPDRTLYADVSELLHHIAPVER
jgi:uncharacterized protein with NRDE domain